MDKQGRWRNGVRLKSILKGWRKLSKPERTTKTLLLATDAARLDRTFVAEKVNDALGLVGGEPIEMPTDAGEE